MFSETFMYFSEYDVKDKRNHLIKTESIAFSCDGIKTEGSSCGKALGNNVGKNPCPECGKYLANVREHMKLVHLKIKNHSCEFCSYKTSFKNDLTKHKRAVHKISVAPNELQEKPMNQVTESCTEGKFSDKMEEGEYSTPTHICKLTKCPYCSKHLANLREHIKAIHEKEKHYFCSICEYRTLFKSDLVKHDDLVHKKFRRSCPDCGKQIANLHEHTRLVHKKIKKYKCNYCGYTCGKKGDIDKHTRNVHKHL